MKVQELPFRALELLARKKLDAARRSARQALTLFPEAVEPDASGQGHLYTNQHLIDAQTIADMMTGSRLQKAVGLTAIRMLRRDAAQQESEASHDGSAKQVLSALEGLGVIENLFS